MDGEKQERGSAALRNEKNGCFSAPPFTFYLVDNTVKDDIITVLEGF